jgi:TolB-like protein/Tfp pilus assembly protein PilF
MRSFLRELRRRNVYRVGAMYAVSGWLLVQIATQVLPIFDVSALAQRLIVLLIVAGFPVALVLSWIYEVTPQGIVRTDAVAPDESITHITGRKLDFVIIAILGVAVVFLVVQHYWMPRAARVAITDKSVAVLPFESLSDDKANRYFADGIQDEILTRLAKVGALKVISRTSTAHYASNPANLPEIAHQLGVANILEGSVQKAGDAVHINVQLIKAATDDHLWAEVYNRKLDDIFGVEGEVAGAIADALNAKLSGAEQAALASKPTQNAAAYEAFLRGRALNLAGAGYANSRLAAAAYAEAVRLDPQFAEAWAQLAIVTGYLHFNNVDADKYTAEFVKHASDTALQLQPQLEESRLAQASYQYRVSRDFAAAEQILQPIVKQSPNDNRALQILGLVERRQGKWEASIAHMQQAATLDPRNAGLLTSLGGETMFNLRRFDEAHRWLDRALEISPGDTLALAYKISTYQAEGRIDAAAQMIDQLPVSAIDGNIAVYRGLQRLAERRYPLAITELQSVLAQPEDALNGLGPQLTVTLGFAQRAAGQTAAAQATFENLIAKLASHAAQVDDSQLPISLGLAYALAGQQQAALDQARRAVELYANDALQGPTAQLALAQVHMLGGDKDAAVADLAKLVKIPAGTTVALLRLDPTWDPLRGDERFQALLRGDAATPPQG